MRLLSAPAPLAEARAAFYRPHETATHRAFPLDLLIAVVCVLDCHSLFQIALGSATWSISYHHDYKRVLTAVILSLSISCNLTGGMIILVGNRRTRKRDVLERRLREALSEEAVRHKEKERIMHETIAEGGGFCVDNLVHSSLNRSYHPHSDVILCEGRFVAKFQGKHFAQQPNFRLRNFKV